MVRVERGGGCNELIRTCIHFAMAIGTCYLNGSYKIFFSESNE